MKQSISVGILGAGTVGKGVVRLLTDNQQVISERMGADIKIRYLADIDPGVVEGLNLKPGIFTSDAYEVINDPNVDIVLELIGGQTVAMDLIKAAIENGKSVVTANKALIANHGNQLLKAADAKGVDFAYEASVGGCMPIIKTLRESLVGNRIHSMVGILNGTCNYILSKITDEGLDFEKALSQAQAIGFAEADPTLDVEGGDTSHKLAILNSLAYGMDINLKDIYVEGITGIHNMDIAFADTFGYRIKLLAISKKKGDTVEARVHPAMIPFSNILSNVNANLNAVMVSADAVGDMLLYGYGAGMMPTASAVVSDIVDIARNRLSGARSRVPVFSYQSACLKPLKVLPIDEIETQYYFRFSALDQPGVLSKIAGILGELGISIKSVHQKGRKTNGSVPVVILTHIALERDVKQAISQIGSLDVISEKPVVIRIEDENGEQ